MTDKSERREFTRIPVNVKVDVEAGTAATLTGEARDLSLNGFFLECTEPFAVGTECDVLLYLGEGPKALQIKAQGKVARKEKNGMGVQLTDIAVESFEHLRNLIQYNAKDPQQVEKEFDSHLGIKRPKKKQ